MFSEFLSAVWRRIPDKLKRGVMNLSQPRFAVTAGAVITDDRERVLLLKHRFRPGTGWGIPGGYIQKGENPEAALRRELQEEAGLELANVEILTVRTFKKPQQVEVVFRCRAAGNFDRLNYEIQRAGWFSLGELPESLPADQLQLIKRAFEVGASAQD